MSFRTTGIAMLGAMALTASAAAQTPQTPPAITRTMVAATKLPAVTDVPLYFKAVSVTIPSGEKSSLSAANGILYQMSGSTEVSFGGEIKMLGAGEALFIPGGKTAMLKAGSGAPSAFLHFLLAAAVDFRFSCRDGTCRYQRIISYTGADPGFEARRLRSQSDASHIPGEDALKLATPSLRGGPLLHPIRHGGEHGWRQDRGQGARFLDIRTVRPRAPMGEPRQRTADLPRLQHQSGRRCSRAPRRTSEGSIAGAET